MLWTRVMVNIVVSDNLRFPRGFSIHLTALNNAFPETVLTILALISNV